MVDIYWLSKVSNDAVAAVGVTESVISLIYALAIGISSGATALVARRIGEKDPVKAGQATTQVIILTLIVSIVVGLVGSYFASDILRLMGGEDKMVEEGTPYTRIMMATNAVIMFLFVLNGVFRGAGNAMIAMWALGLANVINLILDPLFIFGYGPFPEMGVQGAAVATSIGRGCGVLFQLVILFGGYSTIKIKLKQFRLRPKVMKSLINISSGGTLQYLIGSASWIIMIKFIAFFGTEAIAGYTYAVRIIIFTILPAWGLSNAAATLVGQNLGAGKPERAEKSVWLTSALNVGFLLLISIIFFFFAEHMIAFFDDAPKVIAEGTKGLKIFSLGYVAYAFGMVISSAFNGAGDTRTPTIMNFICFWIIEIPLAYYLVFDFGLNTSGVYWAIVIAELVLAIIAIYLFRKGNWKKVQV